MSKTKTTTRGKWPADAVERRSVKELVPYARNARTHSDAQVRQIAASIEEWGWTNPILIDESGGIIAGHGRLMAADKLGLTDVPVMVASGWTPEQKKAYILADNQLALNADWDKQLLGVELNDLTAAGFDVSLIGFDSDFLSGLFGGPKGFDAYTDGIAGSMAAKFGHPPFSVLDTRQGDWQDRRGVWRQMIGDNGETRENKLGQLHKLTDMNGGVSLLDPVLAETIVTWFGLEGGVAIDPFAGDTVFGFVSGTLGMAFKGTELRQDQADANQERCASADLPCKYFCDSGEHIGKYVGKGEADLVFSCPPYADLEVYSDDPRDLSNMPHDEFFRLYASILGGTYDLLKENRFAVVVVGEVRNKAGDYIGLVPKTIDAMEAVGFTFYNEIILINSAGTLPLRAGKQMQASRKIGKMHQNVLVFLKGNAKTASKALGPVDCRDGGEDV